VSEPVAEPPLPPLIDVSSPLVQGQRMQACVTARAGGYFWLPCPLCGVHFGGQEWLVRGSSRWPADIPDLFIAGRGQGICPWCTRAGRGYGTYVDGVWKVARPDYDPA
jgi:hypothetical protein